MFIKRTLNLALCALLLSAGISANAQDKVVTLKDGKTTMTWAEFADSVSDLDAVTGKIETLPASNAAAKALATATSKQTDAQTAYDGKVAVQGEKQTALDTAKGAVTSAQTAVNAADAKVAAALKDSTDAVAVVAQKEAAVETAKAQLTAAQDAYIKGFQDALDEANASLTKKENTDLPKLESSLETYNSNKTTIENSLTNAQTSLGSLQTQYDGLAKVKGTLPWLALIAKDSYDWYNAVHTADFTTEFNTLYIKLAEGKNAFGSTVKQLAISFITPTDASSWTQCTNVQQYVEFFIKDGETVVSMSDFTSIYVYMGTAYAALNNNNTNLTITKPSAVDGILENVYNTIEPLTNQSKYQGYTDEYENPTLEASLRTQIATATANVNKFQGQLDNVESQIATTESAISTLKGEIETLKNTTIPNAKKAVTDAQTAVDNDTATSEAITAAKNAIRTAEGEVTTAKGVVTEKYNAYKEAEEELDEANDTLAEKQAAAATAQTEFDDAKAETTAALATLNSAKSDVESKTEAAQAAADALAQANYTAITLTGNVDVTATINATYSGTINGAHFCFNLASGVNNVFSTFYGTLSNAAINYSSSTGKFAATTNNSTSYRDVATWTGTGGNLYNEGGTATAYNYLTELGYAARNYFGVDFAANKLAFLTDNTKVYNITVYSPDSNKQYYANYVGGTFVSDSRSALKFESNQFVSTADDYSALKNIENLIYQEGNQWKCNNVVIVDAKPFYAPFDIQVNGEVTYNRQLAEGYNTVCFPFELKKEYSDKITYTCTYDTETTEKFWFTKVESAIPANTPALIVTSAATTLDLSSVTTIKATDKTQLAKKEGQTDAKSLSYGTFKTTGVNEFVGAYNSYKVYGLNGGKFVWAGEGARFPAFRMVMVSDLAQQGGENAPRKIGIRDEKGIEITDPLSAIEDVKSEATSFSVVAGQGEITITSDADYGKVPVYSIDGRVAAYADVMVGTTTVNVQRGIYIVMGKKVAVK